MESYLAGYLPQNPYLPGLRLAAPALLLFVSLFLFPHGRLHHRVRTLIRVPMPTWPGTAAFAVAIVVFGAVLATTLSRPDLVTYGPIFSLGIIALSYVPLAGYAGQISLCQLSIAGIGAITWGHLGAHGGFWALGAAIAVSAVVGALIALPALRLSGVYLALATAAFAVVLDRWIFGLPAISILGRRIALFDQSSVPVVGPRLFGHQLVGNNQMVVFAAVCLALACIAVAFLRRSRFGRLLIASRDSEAAYATLGGNLLATKVLVFAFAAGIAGLGGAVYGMQQRSVTASDFTFVAGLPIFLVAVIGGLGALGTGLFTGTTYVGAFNTLVAIVPAVRPLVAILPGLAGLGMARNPGGAAPSVGQTLAPVVRNWVAGPVVLLGFVAAWLLRLAHVVNGYVFVFGTLALFVVARVLVVGRSARAVDQDVSIEWRGIRRPWRQSDGEVIDRGIAAS
jgi:branched-chain amino acid transport system permease protein